MHNVIGRLAVRSLYEELTLYPKPGLVSPVDNGSHHDMDAITLMRSLLTLRHYFKSIAHAGIKAASFASLKSLGIEAERRMLEITNGVNTHRGAIFCLGLLCAVVGHAESQGMRLTEEAIQSSLHSFWGEDLANHAKQDSINSHGLQVAKKYSVHGARSEAAAGFPSLFNLALPTLRRTLQAGRSWRCAQVDVLFNLMAHMSDTNVYHRGGAEGAVFVQTAAQNFLAQGATANPLWQNLAKNCHDQFVQRQLSPGGAADLLAATCFVHLALNTFNGKRAKR